MRLFILSFIEFLLVGANLRAFAHGEYIWTAITDLILLGTGFYTTKLVSRTTSKTAVIPFVLGGVLGSQAAIFLTKLIYGY